MSELEREESKMEENQLHPPVKEKPHEIQTHSQGRVEEAIWFEMKMNGKLPERRSYLSSYLHKDHLYVFGG